MKNKNVKMLSNEKIMHYLDNPDIKIFTFASVGSTNDEARRRMTEGLCTPAVFAAEEQTAGRGRKGHTFFSPSSGLYYTLVTFPEDEQSAVSRMTVAAAVALREAVLACSGIPCDIKWVNDLYVNGRKVAGILCEAPRNSRGELMGIITGIGINIFTEEFPEEIRNTAGSLNCPDLDRNILTAELTNRLMYWSRRLDDPKLINAYRSYSFLTGRTVSFPLNGRIITGKAVDINDDGNLIVRADREYILSSGEVSLASWDTQPSES